MNPNEIASQSKPRDLLWLVVAIPFLLIVLFTVQGSVEVRSAPETTADVLIDGKPTHASTPGFYRSGLMLIGPHYVTVRTAGKRELQTTAFVWLSQRVVVDARAGSSADAVPATAPQSANAAPTVVSNLSRVPSDGRSDAETPEVIEQHAEKSRGDTEALPKQASSLASVEATRDRDARASADSQAASSLAEQDATVRQGQVRQEPISQFLIGHWYFDSNPAKVRANQVKAVGSYVSIETVAPDGAVSGAIVYPNADGTRTEFQGTVEGETVTIIFHAEQGITRRWVAKIDHVSMRIAGPITTISGPGNWSNNWSATKR